MHHFRLSPDDPKLTAHALGQLEGDERAAMEAALRDDPAAREFVEQTRAFSAQLETALATEPEAVAPAVKAKLSTPERREVTISVGGPAKVNGAPLPEYHNSPSKLLRFPQLYFVIGGLAAACFAVVLALREERPAAPVRYYQEVRLKDLPSLAVATPPPEAEPAAPTDSAMFAAKATLEAPVVAMPRPSVFGSADEKGGLLAQVSGMGDVALSSSAQKTGVLSAPQARRPEPMGLPLGAPIEKTGLAAHGGVVLSTYSVTRDRNRGHEFGILGAAAPSRSEFNTEAYAYRRDNDFVTPQQSAFSTFSVDVDTASYANVRRFVEGGRLPPADAVRVEELLNYFPYRYAAPDPKTAIPIAASLEVAEAPWAPTHRLVRIGLKAKELATGERPPANLVFLLDVSGSMGSSKKLPLVKQSMHLLVKALRPDDRVAIVTYAGNSGLALPSTPVTKVRDIEQALDSLTANGSTNGALGIQLAYDIAKANFVRGGINRVILCTDGDFNVGTTSQGELARLIEEKAKTGVALTALGFGMGNVKDSTLELLADKGNGNYGYIDTRHEAEKLLAQQVNGTLMTVAKDVKIQVDFNPERVASYRLVGYENRLLQSQDFNNDAVDAGEIGAGHTVTALYEIVPVGVQDTKTAPSTDPSRYASAAGEKSRNDTSTSSELLTVRIRYKAPDGDVSEKMEFPLTDSGSSFTNASADFKFAAAVAEYGMILRDSPHRGKATMGDVIAWAASGAANSQDDPGGYRGQFLDLARRTHALMQ